MENKEQEIKKEIRDRSEEIRIPENLEPEKIREMLEEREAERGKTRKRLPVYRIGILAAACLTLVCGTAIYYGMSVRNETGGYENDAEGNVKKGQRTEDYADVYAYFEQQKGAAEKQTEERMTEEIAMMRSDEGAVEESGQSYSGSGSYSETNVRQEGVDEGDIVKTDGRYLYVLRDDRSAVSVVDTDGQDMKEVHRIEIGSELWIHEIYLDTEREQLTAICSRQEQGDISIQARGAYWNAGTTEAVTYDISDPKDPKEKGRVTQSGSYHSSRMADGYLYLFSNYSVAWTELDKNKPETYVPAVGGSLVAKEDISFPESEEAGMYTVTAAVDMKAPDQVTDSRAILSQGGDMYVSSANIYYYEYVWEDAQSGKKDETSLRRIGYKDGTFGDGAKTTLNGMIHDSFSIDEYKEHLRVVLTQGETNAVYILNKDLEKTGAIEGLAEEERVYSARFMGDTGYFVTFRETDPLFSVDLSDPTAPKIIGELKIPGFSEYLHPYGEGKLLGIGMNVDEQNMTTDGVKLTMFDISDPKNVKEAHTFILKNVYGTDVSYSYKAALADAQRNIIGFAGYTDSGENYYVFSYDETEGFVSRMEEEINGNTSQSARGVYIEETLYVVRGNVIEAYSMKDYKKTDDLIL